MKHIARILFGALLGFIAMLGGVAVFSALAVWSPFSTGWWIEHPSVVINASEVLAFTPFVLATAFLMRRLFSTSPVLSAFISMVLAVLANDVADWTNPHELVSGMMKAWLITVSFVVGVPVAVWISGRIRFRAAPQLRH